MSFPSKVGRGTCFSCIFFAMASPRFQRAVVKKRGEVYRLYSSRSGPTSPPLPPREWQVGQQFLWEGRGGGPVGPCLPPPSVDGVTAETPLSGKDSAPLQRIAGEEGGEALVAAEGATHCE